MKIAFVAGFFTPVERDLNAVIRPLIDSRAVVLIPHFHDGELDLRRLKHGVRDVLAKGATEVLVYAFVRSKDERGTRIAVDQIVADASAAYPIAKLTADFTNNARDSVGILAKISAFGPHITRPTPTDFNDLNAWAAASHSGKLLFLPRALRGVKKSKFEDIALAYKCLDVLGGAYWKYRAAREENVRSGLRAILDEQLAQIGADISPSIEPAQAKRQGDQYFVQYPPNSSQKAFLDMHLRHGRDRNERYCLRIYFFWCTSSSRVVIGWLTSHLDNSLTN